MSDGEFWPPLNHWSPRFLPLVEKFGTRKVYEIGLKSIGWPPTIDISAGRQWITAEEFLKITKALAAATEKEVLL